MKSIISRLVSLLILINAASKATCRLPQPPTKKLPKTTTSRPATKPTPHQTTTLHQYLSPTTSNDITSSSSLDPTAPLLLRPWIHLYRTAATITPPPILHSLPPADLIITIGSTLLFAIIDYTSAYLLHRHFGWPSPSPHTRAAAGSIATIVHSTLLVLGLAAALLAENNPSETSPLNRRYVPSCRMSSHPPWFRDGSRALMQWCTGYMTYDALVQFGLDRLRDGGWHPTTTDVLFLGHHVACVAYMLSSRVVGAGHMSAMVLMLAGECTAPIMNVMRICRLSVEEMTGDCCGRVVLGVVRPYVELVFAWCYIVCRAAMGPVIAVHLTYDLLLTKRGRKNVPVGVGVVWVILVWGVLIGSVPWVKGALVIIGKGLVVDGGGISSSTNMDLDTPWIQGGE